jgi:DNA-binding XRE family transcriptional regulator
MRVRFKKQMERSNLNQKTLASCIDVAEASISNYFNGSQEPSLDIYLKIVRYFATIEDEDHVRWYVRDIKTLKNLKAITEYCSTHRQFDLMEEVLDIISTHKDRTVKSWVSLYKLFSEWQKNPKKDTMNYIQKIKRIHTGDKTLIALANLFELYIYYTEKKYDVVEQLSEVVYDSIQDVSRGYVKDSYLTRFSEIMSFVELRVRNNPVQARKHADIILNSFLGDTFKGFALHIKGTSFILENEDLCLQNLEQSIERYKEKHGQKVADHLTRNYKLVEQYFFIEKDEKEMIDVTFIEKMISISPFAIYLKGKIESDNKLLLRSLIQILKTGDKYLSQLPERELLANGYDQDIINDLIN